VNPSRVRTSFNAIHVDRHRTELFEREIAPAGRFYYEAVEVVDGENLIKGGSMEKCGGGARRRSLEQEPLRFQDEFVRAQKSSTLFGDLRGGLGFGFGHLKSR